MKEYDTYLFDVDGTLIDTAELIFKCFEYSCRKHANITVTREIVFPKIGLPFASQLESYIGNISDTLIEEIYISHMKYQNQIFKDFLKPFDGIHSLLERLISQNKKIGVVTSRKRESLYRYLEETSLIKFFKCIVTPEDTSLHKPFPEPILEAIKQLDAEAKSTVYIGDSVYDIESGHRAGCDTIFVAWSLVNSSCCHIAPTYVVNNASEIY